MNVAVSKGAPENQSFAQTTGAAAVRSRSSYPLLHSWLSTLLRDLMRSTSTKKIIWATAFILAALVKCWSIAGGPNVLVAHVADHHLLPVQELANLEACTNFIAFASIIACLLGGISLVIVAARAAYRQQRSSALWIGAISLILIGLAP